MSIVIVITFSSKGLARIFPVDSSEYGKMFVTKWADDRQSAFSFSFDDGFKAQYDNVRPILEEYEFNTTYFLLPPFLTDSLPGIWRYGTWPMFLETSYNGSELASHTLNHPHLKGLPVGDTLTPNTIHYELYHSRRMIEERTDFQNCITFAYPYTEHNELVDSLTAIYYESARAVGLFPNFYSLTGMQWYSLGSYEVIFDEPRVLFEDDLAELYNFINWIDGSIEDGTWGIQLAHEVVPFSQLDEYISQGAYNPISNEWFVMLCDWLIEKSYDNLIWIESIGNVTKYMKERDSYSYKILSQSNSLIEIELTDNLDNDIYNYPLTAYISVPVSWQDVLLTQGTDSKVYKSFNIDSMQVILAEAVPDGGVIQLSEFFPSIVETEPIHPGEFILHQNYPNPFNPATTITYELKKGGFVSVTIYDLLGNKINEPVAQERSAGKYSFVFEAGSLASGVYTYVLNFDGKFSSKKMILVK